MTVWLINGIEIILFLQKTNLTRKDGRKLFLVFSYTKKIKYEVVVEVHYLMVRIDKNPYCLLVHSSRNDFYFDGIDDEQYDDSYKKSRQKL